jgi:hypothetical protein
MPEPWSSAIALAVGGFAGALIVGWRARSAVHAGYLALVVVVLGVVALPHESAVVGGTLGIVIIVVAAVISACGFALGRQWRRRHKDDE